MKKRLFYSFLIILLMFSVSCSENFLDLSPDTELTSSTFYKTEDHFKQTLSASYRVLRPIVLCGIYMDEMRADNTFFSYYPQDRSLLLTENFAYFLDDETSRWTKIRWDNAYVGISRTNSILSNIKDADIPEDVKNEISGETLFIRAFCYYDLVQHFGGVPIHLEPVTTEKEAFKARSSVEDVYNLIIKDLNEAIPLLKEVTSFPQSGRATKGAAKMLLAYAYMSKPNREYAKAEAELKDITKMKYKLLDNYSDVFDPANENSSESIFEVQYKAGDTGQQNDYMWRFIPRTSNTDFIMGVIGGNLLRCGWNVPTQEMIDSYEEGDLRLNASIGVMEGPKTDNVMTVEAVKDITTFTPTEGKEYEYFIKKYYHPPYEKPENTGTNWPVFRYSDALLLLAEALVEQGKNSEALSYLNQVRIRAGLKNLSEATKENIANERRHELAFENHRWTDLIRTGKAIETLTKRGQRLKAMYQWIPPNSFNVTKDRLIYPIPYRELKINKLLNQNPGY